MCLIPGIADGKFLIDRELIGEDETTHAACGCAGHGHAHAHAAAAAPVAAEGGDAGLTRRHALGLAAGGAAGIALGGLLGGTPALAAETPPTPVNLDPSAPAQVVFLGTNGGPGISLKRSQPAAALVVNGIVYLVDMGGDVIQQLTKATVPMSAVRHALITHYHSDHVAGWPALALLGWQQTAHLQRLDVWGPTAEQMLRRIEGAFKGDIASREFITGTIPFDQLVYAHTVNLPRNTRRHPIESVFADENVAVSATRVFHGTPEEMPYAYAYRFDIKSGASAGKSVVFSGDTAPTDSLPELAQDCDLMIHEALYPAAIEEALQSVDPSVREALKNHIFSTHTKVEDIPSIAKASCTQRVRLTHLSPGFVPNPVWNAAAQAAAAPIGYAGEIVAANDLEVVTV